jgi:hypothetical protein
MGLLYLPGLSAEEIALPSYQWSYEPHVLSHNKFENG